MVLIEYDEIEDHIGVRKRKNNLDDSLNKKFKSVCIINEPLIIKKNYRKNYIICKCGKILKLEFGNISQICLNCNTFQCPKCSNTYTDSFLLNSHFSHIHFDEFKIFVNEINKGLDYISILRSGKKIWLKNMKDDNILLKWIISGSYWGIPCKSEKNKLIDWTDIWNNSVYLKSISNKFYRDCIPIIKTFKMYSEMDNFNKIFDNLKLEDVHEFKI